MMFDKSISWTLLDLFRSCAVYVLHMRLSLAKQHNRCVHTSPHRFTDWLEVLWIALRTDHSLLFPSIIVLYFSMKIKGVCVNGIQMAQTPQRSRFGAFSALFQQFLAIFYKRRIGTMLHRAQDAQIGFHRPKMNKSLRILYIVSYISPQKLGYAAFWAGFIVQNLWFIMQYLCAISYRINACIAGVQAPGLLRIRSILREARFDLDL